jgi:membrane protein
LLRNSHATRLDGCGREREELSASPGILIGIFIGGECSCRCVIWPGYGKLRKSANQHIGSGKSFSWFAASVMVTAGIIHTLKLQEQPVQPKPTLIPPRATPAQEPLTLQERRAAERGRGRRARAPLKIPLRGWKDIFVRTYYEMLDDRLLALAAGIAFYSLVALFPAIAAGVSVYALFANATTISKHLSIAADIVPAGTLDLLGAEISRIAAKSDGKLTFGFLLGLGIALWSANAGMKAIIDALNIIYDEEEKRGFIWLNVVSLFFTIGAIAAAGLAVALVVVFPLITAVFGLTSLNTPIIVYLRWPLMFVLIILGLAVLYLYGPSRRLPKWRWISVGSVFAALAWLAVSSLFSWYLGNFDNYNATYGALGAVVGLMMWMWLSTIVVLVGAELNSEIEHQTARDSTVGPDKPLGTRGAVMADTVGAAKA